MELRSDKSPSSPQDAKVRAENGNDIRYSDFRATRTSPRYTVALQRAFSRNTTKLNIPIHDNRALFQGNVRRHQSDHKFVGFFDENDNTKYFKYKPIHDDSDIVHVDPSYTKFKVPIEITCRERLVRDTIRYNRQLKSEISKLIDYQNNALEAAYFVRMMSYTTLWPPYHSNLEIANTNRKFYKLSKGEQARYQYIMSHNFS